MKHRNVNPDMPRAAILCQDSGRPSCPRPVNGRSNPIMTQPLAEHIEELAQQIFDDIAEVRRDLSAIAASPAPPVLFAENVFYLQDYRERRRLGVSR